MRVDTHVHTSFSGNTTISPLKYLLRESYNSPEGVYRRAKARGMDLVAITDHDTIAGALTIADRPDVLVGCEVTASFPEDGVRVHLGVLGVTQVHHREMQRLRVNIRELLQYLNREHAIAVGGLVGLPLLAVPLVLAAAHFMLEDRFNRSLLFDLVARPAGRAVTR